MEKTLVLAEMALPKHVGEGGPVLVYPCHGSENQRWTHTILGIRSTAWMCKEGTLRERNAQSAGYGEFASHWSRRFRDCSLARESRL